MVSLLVFVRVMQSLQNILFFAPGSSVDVYADENKILKGILFQTQEMRSSFAAYPELVLIDATYIQTQQSTNATLCVTNSRWEWPS